jgi:mono/diheme cytochrome c family protein
MKEPALPRYQGALTGSGRRSRFASGRLVSVALVGCLLSGCQQKMAVQPSYKPLDPSDFFSDGRSARPLVRGTVARGHLRIDLPLFTGKRVRDDRSLAQPIAVVGTGSAGIGGAFITLAMQQWEYANDVDSFPFPVTPAVLEQGRSRYMIYCVVCHDALGTGQGKIVERGYTAPPSYHIERLRQAPVGHFFDVITNGYGSMPDYREQVPPLDRWAIIAYIRALQLSQHFPEKELTGDMRQEWASRGTLAKTGGPP